MSIRWSCVWAIALLMMACGGETEADGGAPIPTDSAATDSAATDSATTDTATTDTATTDNAATDSGGAKVAATVRVINPATGAGAAGVTVSAGGVDVTTDASGKGTVDVPAGPYQIALNQAGARTHTVFGVAGDKAFEQITYMSPDNITGFVFSSLGLKDDKERGILVVGLDLPNLAPAVGAGATIDKGSDKSFVFAGIQAVFATEIPSNGQGFLTFPNVEPGEVNVTVSYPKGSCRIFPAETDAAPVTVTAGQVTVVAYTCRAQ